MIEPKRSKSWRDISGLENDELIRRFPNKVFTISSEATPAGFLPGVYTGLVRAKFDRRRHRTGPYLFSASSPVQKFVAAARDHSPQLLFSFRGANSHEVRDAIFRRFSGADSSIYKVRHVRRWFICPRHPMPSLFPNRSPARER